MVMTRLRLRFRSEDDVAKVIGRRGRTIKAIRTLARALAARLDTAVEVEVLG